MKRLSTRALGTIAVAVLSSCGGGADVAMHTALTGSQSADDTPDLVSRAASTDTRRMRENRDEQWKPGHALPERASAPTASAEVVAAEDRRARVLAAQPPRAIGTTVPVAPVLTTIPADAGTRGAWSGVYDWPLIPIHLAMLPDGRLMSYGTDENGRQTGKTIYDVFDPALGLINGHMTLPKATLADLFCSATIFLSSTDQMLTVGGDNWSTSLQSTLNTGNNSSNLFTPGTNTLAAARNMNRARWYATTTTLLNGETFIMGGLGGEDRPEIRGTDGTFRLMSGANTSRLDYYYPRNFLAPDGRIFGYDSYANYYYISTGGTGLVTIVNQWDSSYFGDDSTAAMFKPGRILQFGGNSNKAAVIDLRTVPPTFTPTGSLSSHRSLVNATVLPNGTVLATGGSDVYNTLTGVNNAAEIWDPSTGVWTVGAAGALARLYHSVGMLMPDGTVLVGGGGAWGPLNNTNVEFYYPPYLFNADGTMATRPTITSAPTVTNIGDTFSIALGDTSQITKVTMIKTGAVTHSFNMEQRFQELTFTRAGNVLSVQSPKNAVDAPPGYYLLFVLNAAGVPSQARIVKMNVQAVTVTVPAAPTGLSGYTCGAGCWTTDTGIHLNWTQSATPGITQNVIWRSSTGMAGTYTVLATILANTTYTDKAVTAGATYDYKITAVGAGGTGPAGNVTEITSNVTLGGTTAPAAPTGLSGYTCGAGCWTTDIGIHLNWTQSASPGITQNVVWRGTAGDAGPFAVLTTIPAGTTYTDKAVVSGVLYDYKITAVSAGGTSVVSNVTGVTSNVTP